MDSKKPEINYKNHWDSIYTGSKVETLGWYEKSSDPSLRLIAECALGKSEPILIAGAGATTLVDSLLDEGYENLIANDISSVALEELKKRIGNVNGARVKCIVDDLTNPKELNQLSDIALWHDRAVLHFFLEENQRRTYFNLLNKLVRPNGYAVIAAFNLSSAAKCSGLDVHRYNEDMLKEGVGENFKLINSFNNTYTMPSGDIREYVYTLFRKV